MKDAIFSLSLSGHSVVFTINDGEAKQPRSANDNE